MAQAPQRHAIRVPRQTWRGALGIIALSAVAASVMVRLGLWQWGRGQARGSLLNYSYAVEWVVFAVLTLCGAVYLVAEGLSRAAPPPPAPPEQQRRPVPVIGPPLAPGEELPDLTYRRVLRRFGIG